MYTQGRFKGLAVGSVGSVENAIFRLQEDNFKLRKMLEAYDQRIQEYITEIHIVMALDLPKDIILSVIAFL